MKIDEAITDLSIQLEVKHRVGAEYSADALKLGIEALKWAKLVRSLFPLALLERLPGETEK